jgi:mono/diheme cytochrome c family protein
MAIARRLDLNRRHLKRSPKPRPLLVMAAGLVGSLLMAGCVAGDVPEAPAADPVLVEGQAIYTASCVNCHGPAGGGGQGARLNGGRVVTQYPDPADQREVIANGQRAMPAFGEKLSDAELDAVVRYTREILAEQ